MPNRTKTAASPIFAGFLAIVFSTAIGCGAARAANDCLNEPKHQTPAGGHWYYRVDGPNHRKCWFLGEESQKVSPADARQLSTPRLLPQPTAAATQPSKKDAHDEVPVVTTPAEPPQWPGSPSMSNPEKITEVVPDASPPEMPSPPSARDPEPETRAMSNGTINAQSSIESQTELLPNATDREPAAEPSAEETTEDQHPMRLGLLLIALGLSIIAGCLILKRSAAAQAGRRDVFPVDDRLARLRR